MSHRGALFNCLIESLGFCNGSVEVSEGPIRVLKVLAFYRGSARTQRLDSIHKHGSRICFADDGILDQVLEQEPSGCRLQNARRQPKSQQQHELFLYIGPPV